MDVSQLLTQFQTEAILQKLRTNQPPSSDEANEIPQLLAFGERELKKLQNLYDTLKFSMDAAACLLAPIRKLPIELLGKIFLHCRAETPHYSVGSARRTLGGVCTHWRAVVLETPAFWSTHYYRIEGDGNLLVQQRSLPAVHEMVLKRSKSSPLTVDIRSESTHWHPPAGVGYKIRDIALFQRQSHRWKSVTIGFVGDIASCLSPMRGRLSNLEILRLSLKHPRPEQKLDAFEVAPKLREVHLSQLRLGSVRLPWLQIRTLKMQDMSPGEVLTAMSRFPNLRTAYFSCLSPRSGTSESNMVVAPSLQSIRYESLDAPDILHTFASLTTPALTSIEISTPPEQDFALSELSKLLLRSHCIITTLSVEYTGLSESRFKRLLDLLPSLVNLNVKEPQRTSSITQPLIASMHSGPNTSHPVCLPRLESLSLLVRGISFPDEEFLRMIQSRLSPTSATIAHLKYVRLEIRERAIEPTLIDVVQGLRKTRNGLDIFVKDSKGDVEMRFQSD